MQKRLLLVTLLFLITCSLHAQFQNGLWTGKQGYNWPGYDEGLDFSTSPPQLAAGGQNTMYEGYGAISDTAGNLLFYSDGITVWDKNHDVMENGEGLLGNSSSTQSGLIIPKPGNEGHYYVFSTEYGSETQASAYYYSEIDMSLNGGLGAVTSNKNILLPVPVGEKITAIYHADGEQIWVISHAATIISPNNIFNAFLVSETGVSTTPVVSAVGGSIWASFGQMKVSPDGKRIAFINLLFFDPLLQVFDFDSATGELSNPINLNPALEYGWMGYGLEFSPNSRFLYIGEQMPAKLRQFDLESGNAEQILASETVLAEYDDYEMGIFRIHAIQAGPDGKVYAIRHNYSYCIDCGEEYEEQNPGYNIPNGLVVIEYPNNPGTTCGINLLGIEIQTQSGLPGFIQDYFESGILYEGESCSGSEIAFSTLRIPGITSISWDFGDTASSGNTSTDLEPAHIYNTAGTYTVTATITSNGAIQTATTEVTINPVPVVSVPGDGLSKCADNSGIAMFDLTAFNSGILNGQDPESLTITYYSSEQDIAAGEPVNNPQEFSTPGQTVFAVVANNETGCSVNISFELNVLQLPVAAVPSDVVKCSDAASVIFDLTQQDEFILQGQNSDEFAVVYFDDMADVESNNPLSQPSEFTSTGQLVYAIVINTVTGCSSAVVFFEISVQQPSVSDETFVFEGCGPFNLIEIANELMQGQTPAFYASEQDAIEKVNAIDDTSKYMPQNGDSVFIRVEDAGGCATIYALTLQIVDCEIPRGISPNDDGDNDSFDLASFDVSELKIFNRYGMAVFSKKNYSDEWHGQSDAGQVLPDGTYFYVVQLGNGESKTGWVYVIRKS